MIDINIALLGFVDSLNIVLLGALFIGWSNDAKRRQLWLLIISDWAGILAAMLALGGVLSLSNLHPPEASKSPLLGLLIFLMGIFGLIFPGANKKVIVKVSTFTSNALAFPARTICYGGALGFLQSLTSVPFIGGVASILSTGSSAYGSISSLLLYSTFAISAAVVLAIMLQSMRKERAEPVTNLQITARWSSFALTSVGIFLIVDSFF